MSIALRPATLDDHDAIVALPDLSASTRRFVSRELARDVVRHLLVADDAGEIVGFASATRQPDEIHLLDIVVRPDHRRRGLGRRLVTALAALGAADGATALTLEARASNPAGPPLYRSLGFTDAGVRPGYYRDGEDALIMWHHDLRALAGRADPADMAALADLGPVDAADEPGVSIHGRDA